MLIKLLKYELKWNYKELAIFYILALIVEMLGDILSAVLNILELSGALSELCLLCRFFTLGILACALIIGTVRILIRFVKTTYQDEAYLTHTLPIDKKTMLISKILSAIIITITTFVITVLCLYRICTNVVRTNIEIIDYYLSDIDELIKGLMIIFTIHIQAILIILVGYTSIIIGYKQGKERLGKSLLIGIITYIVMSVILGIISKIIGTMLGENNFEDLAINLSIIKLIFMTSIYASFGLIFYKKSKEELEKGIDID